MHHTFPCNRLTFSSHPLHPPYTPYWQAHDLPGEERGINGIGPSIVHSRHLPMYRPNGQYSLLPTEPSLFFLGERLHTIFVNARIQHTQHIAISTLIFYLTFSINLHHYPPAFLPPSSTITHATQPTDTPLFLNHHPRVRSYLILQLILLSSLLVVGYVGTLRVGFHQPPSFWVPSPPTVQTSPSRPFTFRCTLLPDSSIPSRLVASPYLVSLSVTFPSPSHLPHYSLKGLPRHRTSNDSVICSYCSA